MGCGASVHDVREFEELSMSPNSFACQYSELEMSELDADGIGGINKQGFHSGYTATPNLRYDESVESVLKECESVELAGISDFPDLSTSHSLMAQCLTEDMWSRLRDKRTLHGVSIEDICQVGISNPSRTLTVGCVAGDEESYELFAELLDPVIAKCHNAYRKNAPQIRDLNPQHLLGTCRLDSAYVLSCDVGASRNVRGYCLAPRCSRAERRQVEAILAHALCTLKGELAGRYYPLSIVEGEYRELLIPHHDLFERPTSPYMLVSGMARDWPDARGLWHNQDNTLLVAINIKEHCRLISMEQSGNMKAVFKRFCQAVRLLEEALKSEEHEFMFSKHRGYLHACPCNLGTGVRASVRLKLPHLASHDRFNAICSLLRLRTRQPGGVAAGVCDVFNMDVLGCSEVDIVQRVVDGVNILIKMEKTLEAGEPFDSLVPIFLPSTRTDYPDLHAHHSLMARHLSPELYHRLSCARTHSGFTLAHAIQSGVDCPGSPTRPSLGCVAGDEETYEVFNELFEPVIVAWYGEAAGVKKAVRSGVSAAWVELEEVGGEEEGARGVRVCGRRSLRGFCLAPHICRSERRAVESVLLRTLARLPGTYHALKRHHATPGPHCLPKPCSAAGLARDWPDARGVWVSAQGDVTVWINHIDHFRINVTHTHLYHAVHRYTHMLKDLEDAIREEGYELMWHERLGYLNTSPAHLGTAMTASARAWLPHLSKHTGRLQGILHALRLAPTEASNQEEEEKEEEEDGEWEEDAGEVDVCVSPQLGVSEAAQIGVLMAGLALLRQMEERCAQGEAIEDLMPPTYQSDLSRDDSSSTATLKVQQVTCSNMPELTCSHNNWMAQCLTEPLYRQLAGLLTASGFSLDALIQPGVDDAGRECCMAVGAVAGDEDSYRVFAPLLDAIIEGRHGYSQHHRHLSDLDPEHLEAVVGAGAPLDPAFVLSCRVRVCRNVRPLALPPNQTRVERRYLERVVTAALAGACGGGGCYYRLRDIGPRLLQRFQTARFMAQVPAVTAGLVAAGMARDWPDARGFWHSKDGHLYAWLNVKDHVRVASVCAGGDMGAAFRRLVTCVDGIEAALQARGFSFQHSERLGYLAANPSNLGTGLRASVHIRLTQLSQHHKFGAILESLQLEKRGKAGVDGIDPPPDGIYDISNLSRLGTTEVQQVCAVMEGVRLLVRMEKSLRQGLSIAGLMPEKALSMHLPEDSISELGREIIQHSYIN